MYDCPKFTAGFMNLANMATIMHVTGCIFDRLTALELNTASRIVSSVGVFSANSYYMDSHEKGRRLCLDLFWSGELAHLSLYHVVNIYLYKLTILWLCENLFDNGFSVTTANILC